MYMMVMALKRNEMKKYIICLNAFFHETVSNYQAPNSIYFTMTSTLTLSYELGIIEKGSVHFYDNIK